LELIFTGKARDWMVIFVFWAIKFCCKSKLKIGGLLYRMNLERDLRLKTQKIQKYQRFCGKIVIRVSSFVSEQKNMTDQTFNPGL
jgi:hypothetical protein